MTKHETFYWIQNKNETNNIEWVEEHERECNMHKSVKIKQIIKNIITNENTNETCEAIWKYTTIGFSYLDNEQNHEDYTMWFGFGFDEYSKYIKDYNVLLLTCIKECIIECIMEFCDNNDTYIGHIYEAISIDKTLINSALNQLIDENKISKCGSVIKLIPLEQKRQKIIKKLENINDSKLEAIMKILCDID